MHTKLKLFIPAGAVAAAVLAACAVPPPPPHQPVPPTTKPPVTTPTTKPKPPPPPVCPTPATNTKLGPDGENPISSWGVDGTGYASVAIGNIVYVGGTFNNAVSTAGTKVARGNLAAFCIANGALVTGFVANFNGPVWALTSDGANLFVGGDFTTLNGASVNRLVKLSPLGARFTSFNPPPIPDAVFALDYTTHGPHAGSVFVGGDFAVGGQAKQGKKGVSVDHITGASTHWNPNADATIQALKVSPDGNSVYIGGTFENVGGAPRDDLAKTAASTGAVSSIAYSTVNGQLSARVLSIAVDPDNVTIYVSAGPDRPPGNNGGNKLYRFSSSGSEAWNVTFKGDDQAVVLIGTTLFTGFHGGFLCTVPTAPGCNLRVLGVTTAAGAPTSFSPNSNGTLGVRGLALASGGNRLIAVGDFTSMGSITKLHGLAIFN